MKNIYMTGWFGIPGGRAGGRVHVIKNGKTLCGERIHKNAEFQFCAHGIYDQYIECNRCKERAKRVKEKGAK